MIVNVALAARGQRFEPGVRVASNLIPLGRDVSSCWRAGLGAVLRAGLGERWCSRVLVFMLAVTMLINPQPAVAWDDGIAIIVNLESPLNSVNRDELISVFLGRSRQLANGVAVVPLDQMEGSLTRGDFYAWVINKTESQMNSYWSRLIFSGKGRPPFAVADDQEVLELIAGNRNMLGYVRASAVTPAVKVILMVPAPSP